MRAREEVFQLSMHRYHMMLSLLSILAATVVLIFCIGSIQTVHGFVGVSIQRWQLHRTSSSSSREIITTLIAHHQPQDNDDILPSSSNSNYLSLIEKSTKGHGIRDDKGFPSTATTAITTRRENLSSILSATSLSSSIIFATTTQLPQPAYAKCTDIESCREEGERKIEADLISNPIVKLSDGVRYRVLSSPPNKSTSKIVVTDESNIDIAYSISTASGQYMYSKGFGYEKINFGDKKQLVPDKGLDSLTIILGKHNVPIGIERALIGMTRGEIRRIELPPNVGFETSNWEPSPITRRGKTQIEQYKRKLVGFGSQPPFPAETVWDVEVLIVR